ncbi:fimbrial isopeptide formation D2 family protein/LPXTG-motif cell wall-anchored protein [Aequitasia blattaphilus]|uniref:SpaH/EbpB family LPXTG-anchored major pilin n=1 Tax=Aequitasia blattaphilus TaxID=2949332 RepID=A0ABT1EA64_9FIRM|nr:SpaH/EbpB family LPXTG-anchored major pilin [Aequitasia blattaphilus]MCP1102702.1 SpaH/EbpB family LPXTG-anchored major pilin [Aequitasia blattaphilus]MCR8615342.1 SpaH/EbpB family LPXTG-anchored major pilin [Aequitasia blattaphilus]
MLYKKMKKAIVLFGIIMSLNTTSLVAVADNEETPDPSVKGSITVHKFGINNEPTEAGDGLEITDADKLKEFGEPLDGVGFTLYMVKDDFEITQSTTPEEAKANAVKVGNEEIAENGKIVFPNLDSVRYYVLEETTPPEGEYAPMDMVIVSVPYGYTGTGSGWNYNVHVYPKNVNIEEVTKEVVDEEIKYFVGDTVTWKISGRINKEIRKGEAGSYEYGYYRLVDTLDSRLYFTPGSETVQGVRPDGTTIPLIIENDYIGTSTSGSHTVTFELTEKGIDRLLDGGAGRIEVIMDTMIGDTAFSTNPNNGRIENDVTKQWSNHDETETKEANPANKPGINLAYVEIMKVDHEDHGIKLDGAQFKIAASLKDAQDRKFIKNDKGEDWVVTSGADSRSGGEEHGFGIFIGLTEVSGQDKDFYLVEVKAPNAPSSHSDWKYVLRPDVIKVTIPEEEPGATVTIENTRVGKDGPGPVFMLPMTGGRGTILFTVVGVLLIGVGVIALKKTKKERE